VQALWDPTKSQIHPVDQIYLMGGGYVRADQAATLLEPDEDQTCLAGRIYPMEMGYVQPDSTATVLKPDPGSDMFDVSDMSDQIEMKAI
jgi:hypothetical protein